MKKVAVFTAALLSAGLITVTTARAAEGHEHAASSDGPVTVTGEVLDMACYVDHGAKGEGHAKCARTCIESGLPVGIKGEDGKTYLLIGDHKPLNKELAAHAAKTITVKGKHVERDGIHMIANAQIVK
jgi:type 1 fimbria pilin